MEGKSLMIGYKLRRKLKTKVRYALDDSFCIYAHFVLTCNRVPNNRTILLKEQAMNL